MIHAADDIARIILLLLLIACAVGVNLTKSLLQAIIIFMSYSSVMCIIWVLMESPDLAITEAAVGAGVSSMLFLMALKKIRPEDAGESGDDLEGFLQEEPENPEESAAELPGGERE